MHQTSTKCTKCSRDLIRVNKDVGIDDLPEEVSANGERATFRLQPTMMHGPPKEGSLVIMEERKRA